MNKIIITIAFALALALALPVFARQEAYIIETPKEEVVEKQLTPKEKILKAFPDAPIMVRIADAESDFRPNATNPHSSASGLFQILRGTWKYYGCEGDFETDRFDVDKNIACARKLYDKSGTSPWNPSKHDWGRYL